MKLLIVKIDLDSEKQNQKLKQHVPLPIFSRLSFTLSFLNLLPPPSTSLADRLSCALLWVRWNRLEPAGTTCVWHRAAPGLPSQRTCCSPYCRRLAPTANVAASLGVCSPVPRPPTAQRRPSLSPAVLEQLGEDRGKTLCSRVKVSTRMKQSLMHKLIWHQFSAANSAFGDESWSEKSQRRGFPSTGCSRRPDCCAVSYFIGRPWTHNPYRGHGRLFLKKRERIRDLTADCEKASSRFWY